MKDSPGISIGVRFYGWSLPEQSAGVLEAITWLIGLHKAIKEEREMRRKYRDMWE